MYGFAGKEIAIYDDSQNCTIQWISYSDILTTCSCLLHNKKVTGVIDGCNQVVLSSFQFWPDTKWN